MFLSASRMVRLPNILVLTSCPALAQVTGKYTVVPVSGMLVAMLVCLVANVVAALVGSSVIPSAADFADDFVECSQGSPGSVIGGQDCAGKDDAVEAAYEAALQAMQNAW